MNVEISHFCMNGEGRRPIGACFEDLLTQLARRGAGRGEGLTKNRWICNPYFLERLLQGCEYLSCGAYTLDASLLCCKQCNHLQYCVIVEIAKCLFLLRKTLVAFCTESHGQLFRPISVWVSVPFPASPNHGFRLSAP